MFTPGLHSASPTEEETVAAKDSYDLVGHF